MNIKEAKEHIKRAADIYLAKDKFGNYKIPIEKQRPIFLLGAPGIGKTAIMEQIAEELELALVSYSMTHHTRQSALGLPFIVEKNYGGEPVSVSEYTMSEIIANIYATMEKTGKNEGILFLDEINCVSETLAPSMLQFLQYKIFGNHKVPDGWVIVTAGNPPEYNRSVHDFDVVTLDRLKVIEAEPDYETWKVYAAKKGIHKAVRTYLDLKNTDFYSIENAAEGKTYVTARGWEDLSEAIFLYEEKGYPVEESLISQYIRNKRIAGEFATYYSLYLKYKSDYGIKTILTEGASEAAVERGREAGFDERVTVIGLIIEGIITRLRDNVEATEGLKYVFKYLVNIKAGDDIVGALSEAKSDIDSECEKRRIAGALNQESKRTFAYAESLIDKLISDIKMDFGENDSYKYLQKLFNEKVSEVKSEAEELKKELNNAFDFVERAYGDSNEMLLLVTELTVNRPAAKFIVENGCDKYYIYNKRLMLEERSADLLADIRDMERMAKEAESRSGDVELKS